MARRKKKEAAKVEPGAPLWMVTYSDMVTLLLCFFVMQLVYANFEEPGKVDAAIQSIHAAFGTGGYHQQKQTENTPAHNSDMAESKQEATQNLVAALRSVLAEMMSQDLIRMTTTKTEIRIMIDEMVLFKPGSSDLNPVSLAILSDIAEALHDEPISLIVEGHADADGTTESKNWMMSATRAVTVVNELRRKVDTNGVPLLDGRFLEAHALGEFHPTDVSQRSSKWNRRVELVIRGQDPNAYGAIQKLDQALEERNGRRKY